MSNISSLTPPADDTMLSWQRIVPIFIVVCAYSAATASVLPVLPFLVRDMGGSPLTLGVVVGSEAISQFFSAPTLGQLSDKLGRKRILMLCQTIAAASLLLLALAPNIAIILTARVLFGLTAGNVSVTMAYVADHTSASNRRQAMGILMAGAGFGGILGAGMSGLLSDISLTTPILVSFALVLGAIVVTWIWLKDERNLGSGGETTPREKHAFSSIFANSAVRILVAVMLFHFLAYGLYLSQLPVFLTDTFSWNGHAFTAKELSYIVMADGAINIFAQVVLLQWLSRRLSEKNLIILLFGFLVTGFVTASLAASIPVLFIAVFFISTSDALAKPTYLAALSNRIPPERQGVVMGAAQSLVALADAGTPVLGGFILGFALYGLWIGLAVALAVMGAVLASRKI